MSAGPAILCCGEALVDCIPTGETASEGFRPHPGGAVFNTAIGLGRLDAPAGFFAPLSTDQFGTLLRDTLEASNVDTALCPSSPRNTTLAFVQLTDGHATYTFYDENSAGRMLRKDDLPALPDSVQALHFGAISLIPEPCGGAYEALCLREAPSRVISLDPNIRPGFIDDEAGHRARMERMVAAADIVKVSDEDMDWLAPAGGFVEQAIERGVRIVVVTRGAKGATAHGAFGEVAVAAPKVTVVDTVGAGDTFNSGFLDSLFRADVLTKQALREIDGRTVEAALAHAARVAAVTVSRAGANAPWRHEL